MHRPLPRNLYRSPSFGTGALPGVGALTLQDLDTKTAGSLVAVTLGAGLVFFSPFKTAGLILAAAGAAGAYYYRQPSTEA